MNYKEAFKYAEKYGPSKETKQIACTGAIGAYSYVRDIDKCPHKDTREASCRNPLFACSYAKNR
jgi:hypothetical protein